MRPRWAFRGLVNCPDEIPKLQESLLGELRRTFPESFEISQSRTRVADFQHSSRLAAISQEVVDNIVTKIAKSAAGLQFFAKGNYARHQPLGPHIVDLALEVIDVVVFEMCKAALL